MAIASKFPNTFPSLNLDFAKTKELDPRVTFTRASTATFVDSTGALRTAQANQPRFTHNTLTGECLGLLIEEQRTNSLTYSDQFNNAAWTKSNSFVQTNLLTYSEQFDNAAWVKANASITANSTTAPNGTTTADSIVVTSSGATETGVRTSTAQANSTTYTASIYVKYTNTRYFVIRNLAIAAALGDQWVFFDLVSGTVATKATGITATITSVGNGWYRCTASAATLASIVNNLIDFRMSDIDGGYSVTAGNTILLWGAQLVQGSSAGEYTQTVASTAPVTYTDPFNAKTAMKLVENTATSTHYFGQNTTILSGTTYTFSCYIKAAERTFAAVQMGGVGFGNQGLAVNLTTGAFVAYNSPTATSVVNAGNGWWRVSVSANSSGVSGTPLILTNITLNSQTYTGDGTSGIYITDAQFEAGAFPTSYIPTTVSTVTRSAETASITGTNFSQWYNQGEGTLFVDLNNSTRVSPITYPRLVALVGSNANLDEISIYTRTDAAFPSLGQAFGSVTTNGVTLFDPGSVSNQIDIWKAAIAYKTNDTAYAASGAVSSTDTSVILPNAIAMSIGGAVRYQFPIGSCTYKTIRYYPERLSNEQIQALTS